MAFLELFGGFVGDPFGDPNSQIHLASSCFTGFRVRTGPRSTASNPAGRRVTWSTAFRRKASVGVCGCAHVAHVTNE